MSQYYVDTDRYVVQKGMQNHLNHLDVIHLTQVINFTSIFKDVNNQIAVQIAAKPDQNLLKLWLHVQLLHAILAAEAHRGLK